jgi:hypothetical protein
MLPEMLAGLGQAGPRPQKESFTGTHYAKEPIKGGMLHGDKRGSTGEGEESARVFLPPRGAPAAVHVYENSGQVFGKHPQILARPHAYQVKGDYALATIENEPKWGEAKNMATSHAVQSGMDPKQAELIGRNEAEWALQDAGYDGYKSKNLPGNVVLFGDHPAKSVDKVQKEKEQDKLDTSVMPEQTDSQSSVKADVHPVFSAPYKFPMAAPDMHESHPAGSDPAHLISHV